MPWSVLLHLCPSQHPPQSSVLPAHKGRFPQNRALQSHSGMGIQAAGSGTTSATETKPLVPSDSSAADSGNLHNQQLKGKGPVGTELGPPGKGSHSLPQSSHSLRQRGPKSVAKSSLRHGRQQQGSSPWNGFRLPSLP